MNQVKRTKGYANYWNWFIWYQLDGIDHFKFDFRALWGEGDFYSAEDAMEAFSQIYTGKPNVKVKGACAWQAIGGDFMSRVNRNHEKLREFIEEGNEVIYDPNIAGGPRLVRTVHGKVELASWYNIESFRAIPRFIKGGVTK